MTSPAMADEVSLKQLIQDMYDWLKDRSDVYDGSDGFQFANAEMKMLIEFEEEIQEALK